MAEESKPYISTSDQSSSIKSPETILNQPQQFCGFANGGAVQMLPIMYPAALVPGLFPMQQQQDQEQMNRGGAGLYAVPTLPLGPYAGFPTNTLIPFTYNVPTGTSQATGAVGGEAGQMGQQQQQQQQQAGGAQRQVVVRRFQIAIHLDLLLILKLAAVIFLLNQDGSRQRLLLLIFSATLVYLYQTGALAPLVRWLSQGMHRAAARPIQPPRPPVRADNAPPAAAAAAAAAAAMPADGHGDGGVQNDGNQDGVENEDEQLQQPPQGGGNRWWGIVKEVQMIVFGFITSLLPGFHNLD